MDAKLAKSNFDFCQETMQFKTDTEISLINLGGRLHKIFIEKLYEPNYETFSDFLQDLKLSTATASKLIHIHMKLVMQYKFKPKFLAEVGGWSSISEVVALITSKTSAVNWLNKVKVLNREDLRKEIKEKKTGIMMRECKHKHTREITLCFCDDCGDKWRKYESETQQKDK